MHSPPPWKPIGFSACLVLGAASGSCLGIPSAGDHGAPQAAVASAAVQAPAPSPSSEDADAALADRVRNALHEDPYFYDAHVDVSVKQGQVTLRGFVFSDWDLRNALQIARKAAAPHPVINELSIKTGGGGQR